MALSLILLTNGSRLYDPPYWDALTGLYTQGIWLYRYHFDYVTLSHLPHFMGGGPNIQLFYFFSPLFAILLHLFRLPLVYLLLHLIVMSCAAVALTLFFDILRSRCPPWLALMWILSAAFNPIWSGQTASVYVEVPLAALIALSIYALWQRRYGLAASACMAAYFMKGSALLFALAYVVYTGLLTLGFGRRSKRQAMSWRSGLILAVPYFTMLILNHWAPFPIGMFHDLPGYLLYFFYKARFQFPTLAVEFLLVPILFGFAYLWPRNRTSTAPDESEFRFDLFLTIYVLGFWLSFILETIPLPRYTVMVTLPLTCLIASLTSKHVRLSGILSLAILGFGLITQAGRRLPPIPSYRGARSGNELERSREYLKDLDANREICQVLETRFFNEQIMTKSPFTQMLTIPEFGYVSRPLPYVIEAGRYSTVCPAAPLPWFLHRPGKHRTICIYSPNKDELGFGPSLKPTANDLILFEDHSLPAANVVYLRDWDKNPIKPQ